MASVQSSPSVVSGYSRSPLGKQSRRSPDLQRLQSVSQWVNFYGTPPPAFGPAQQMSSLSIQEPSPTLTVDPSSEPAPKRWTGSSGLGARHVHDDIPFSFFDKATQTFIEPTTEQARFMCDKFAADGGIEYRFDYLIIKTSSPPQPVPLTVGCMPAIFAPPGYDDKSLFGKTPYPNPRMTDPLAPLRLSHLRVPETSVIVEIIERLQTLANVRRINVLYGLFVVELEHGDGRVYEPRSLPGYVAGWSTWYHHDALPLIAGMKDHARERLLDPLLCMPGLGFGPLPQDANNYLRHTDWGTIGPGVRLTTGPATGAGTRADAVQSSTCGIKLRKGASRYVTVADHAFQAGSEVFHPSFDGDKIGDITDRYPKLDVALVKLTPANADRFTNDSYFQAEPPKRLVGHRSTQPGTFFEVDGMSTGLITLCNRGRAMQKPLRPPGHPEVPVNKWEQYDITRILGATNPQMLNGLCGAPLVEVITGNVAGFFHSASGGGYADCASLEDLVTEGYEMA